VSNALRLSLVTAAIAIIALATATPAAADGIVDPAPIAPNQHFIGEVNAHTGTATINVTCLGPVAAGQTGHPAPGQTVAALPVTVPVSNTAGFTGTAADSIVVSLTPPSAASVAIILHDWVVTAPIPATLALPCSGSGVATFTPAPSSPTAKAATVAVTFVPVA
jgi:hypothetical protein